MSIKYEIPKEELEELLKKGDSIRTIAAHFGCAPSTLRYRIEKYDLHHLVKPNRIKYTDDKLFNKIDTKEKAYIIGYSLADAYVSNDVVEFGCQIADKELLQFIADYIKGPLVTEDLLLDKEARRFPRARLHVYNKNIVTDFNKHMSQKQDKHVPIIPKELERYLIQGFFDGDGTLTWGYRADRDRVWQKVAFTSQEGVLVGIQKILLKQGISSAIKPKTGENVSVMEFAAKETVLKFLDYIYPDDSFIILNRKYEKAKALRLELGEFGEPKNTELSR